MGYRKSANMGLFWRVLDDGPSKPGVPRSSRGGRAIFGQISRKRGFALRNLATFPIVRTTGRNLPTEILLAVCGPFPRGSQLWILIAMHSLPTSAGPKRAHEHQRRHRVGHSRALVETGAARDARGRGFGRSVSCWSISTRCVPATSTI